MQRQKKGKTIIKKRKCGGNGERYELECKEENKTRENEKKRIRYEDKT